MIDLDFQLKRQVLINLPDYDDEITDVNFGQTYQTNEVTFRTCQNDPNMRL